jgi:ubiquitin C-terminal hydrolase
MKFFEREHVDDLVECDGCKKEHPKGVKADKEFFIYHPPKILTILLKRFKSHGFSLMKNSASIDTLEKIYLDDYVIIDNTTMTQLQQIYGPDIKERIENAKPEEESLHLFEYRLYAISTHSGSIYGGHYTAHVKHGNQWYYASDSHTSPEDLSHALNDEAYILFYERIW